MTPRRQHMIAALQRSGKSERTQQSSVREVRLLAQCSPTSPDRLSAQELQRSFLHRTNGDASPQPPCASATVACASSLSLSSHAPGVPSHSSARKPHTVSPPSSVWRR